MAICAGCNTVYPWAAFVIGLVAGLVFMLWSFLIEKLKIDDPLDAVAGIVFLIFFRNCKVFSYKYIYVIYQPRGPDREILARGRYEGKYLPIRTEQGR